MIPGVPPAPTSRKRLRLDLKYEASYLGSTDASALTQAGVPAVALGHDPSPTLLSHPARRLDQHESGMPSRGVAVAARAVNVSTSLDWNDEG